ncbi:hypothetical protein DY000_02048507 [Brassica cretica]|uniref:Uncharacterized protein n=1 Tax=Brassica cretica TaxID=69181 RepID=A0ABQ7F7R6_BRACR|nr:hypothetical protein DY000_02048507 [Brassica cretica]
MWPPSHYLIHIVHVFKPQPAHYAFQQTLCSSMIRGHHVSIDTLQGANLGVLHTQGSLQQFNAHQSYLRQPLIKRNHRNCERHLIDLLWF